MISPTMQDALNAQINSEQYKERDYASEITLQWYVTEQVEEEATISEIVDQLHAIGGAGGAIWYLDSRMGKRAQS